MSLFVIATLLAASPRVVLTSETAGVLTVSYQDLRKAGLRGTGFLHLERNGQPIHFWTERSGWSSGNTAYYISRGKEGLSWLEKEVSSADHVVATLRPTASARRHGLESKKPGSCEPDPILRSTRTYEYDQIREHMPHQLPESRESWFWKRVDAASPPAILNIALPGLVRSHQELTRVRIRVDSPSRLAPELSSRLSDHRVRIAVNGKVVGYREWSDSGREHWLDLELRSSLLAEDTQLEILVPPRRDPRAPKRNLVDVVFVGAVEVRYPREGRLRWADRIHVDERGAECVNLEQETLLLQRFGAGARLSPGLHRLQSPDGDWTFWTAHLDEVDKPHLRRLRMPPPSGDTEYWMIASDTYHNALLPLIEFHQKRGLKVARVSPETLFDHYTDGKPTADAIRRFVEDTEKHDLRYVLLVGNAKSNGIQSPLPTGYLPSGWVNASIGRAPSDQWFVQHPSARKVAIGRLPVTSTEEARLLVRKTLDYATQSNGPWQRRIVWYQDREAPYELQERRIAEMSERGFESIVLSPATPNLRSATVDWLDRGALLTHFKGHGFRTYLRVGAAGAAEDAYVLQAEDLARESTSPHQTIFVALSCYTAEFTHPTSTSVAEQLLLRPKGGAVAVLAPTWANWPGFTLTRGFFEGLTPGATVGQASRNARDFVNRPALRLQYVLLGDPALPIPIARPEAN